VVVKGWIKHGRKFVRYFQLVIVPVFIVNFQFFDMVVSAFFRSFEFIFSVPGKIPDKPFLVNIFPDDCNDVRYPTSA